MFGNVSDITGTPCHVWRTDNTA